MPSSQYRILISGSSGLIGSALIPTLEHRGFVVTRLVRRDTGTKGEIVWDPTKALGPELISGFDAVIHLAGESVVGRWTGKKKARIFDSRVLGTTNLSKGIANASQPPRVMISASAIGYYGDRGEEILREESSAGDGFLPEICRQWEAATKVATDAGIRVVHIRIGVVLSSHGGALSKMLPAFRLGLGGKIGSGRQWMSWIHIEDLVGAIHHILENESLRGPANLVAPNPARNSEFTKTLGSVLSRPSVFPVPAFALRLIFGQMADEALLSSTRVEPARLAGSGYQFKYPDLNKALENILRKGKTF